MRAVLVVAADFRQDQNRLEELSRGFLADEGVPLSFLQVDALLAMIEALLQRPWCRNLLRWSHIVCSGSLVSIEAFRTELQAAGSERYPAPTFRPAKE